MSEILSDGDVSSRRRVPHGGGSADVDQGGAPGWHVGDDGGEIRQIVNILRRRKVLIAIILIIGTIGAAAVVKNLTPRYMAEAALLLDSRPTRVVDIPAATVRQLLGGPQADVGVVHSELAVLRSPRIAESVIKQLNLLNNPEFSSGHGGLGTWIREYLTPIAGVSWQWFGTSTAEMKEQRTGAEAAEAAMNIATDRLTRNLSVTADPRSYVIRVGYESKDPKLAASIANTVAEAYVTQQLAEKQEAVRRANVWLSDRVSELREKVDQSEGAAERFKEANGLSEVRGMTVNAQQLSELNSQIIIAAGARAQKEAELRQIETFKSSNPSSNFIASPLLQHLREQDATLARQQAELASRFGPAHPKNIDIEAQRRDIRKKIAEEVDGRIKALMSEVSAARAREGTLRSSLAQLQAADRAMSENRVQLRQLEQEAEANRALFASLLNRSKAIESEADIQQPDARIIARARVPDQPSFPKARLLVPLAAIGSALIGLTLAFGRELMDRTFRTTRQIEQLTMRPCLGLMPNFSRSAAPDELGLRRDASPYADAIRSIRLALARSKSRPAPKVVLVTSAVPAEGKSVFALSLARSAAQAGHRTLLIDCDLRRPSVSRLLRQPPGVDLISFCQEKETSLAITQSGERAQIDTESTMHFIPTAGHSRSPQDLLNSPATRDFLDRMRSQYDLIVLDTPPILAASDALVLAPLADTTVFLVRWGVTPRSVATHALRTLAREGVALAGTVLSRVDERKYRSYGEAEYGYFLTKHSKYYG
jgi:capsular exopolysaccharide synthesis family protein